MTLKAVLWLMLLITVILATVYALWVRKWLKTKPWAQPFFDFWEPWEVMLFKKSETILFARLKQVTGVVLAIMTQIGAIDITPLLPVMPAKYQGVIIIRDGLASKTFYAGQP